jgi:hypothetical protein
MNCIFCNRCIKNKGSLSAHEKTCNQNPNKIKFKRSPLAGQKKGCKAWNKGLSKKDNINLSRPNQIGKKFGASLNGHSKQTKNKLSKIAKKRNFGGYVRGSGRGKKGWYKGIFCDSSWELAYVIFCMEHNISIKRNTEKRSYVWKGKKLNYIPDFIVENKLIEIKGWQTLKWKAKIKYNPDITVLYENDLKNVFSYVIDKYGKNFIILYEGN